jgi:hypothetical protein
MRFRWGVVVLVVALVACGGSVAPDTGSPPASATVSGTIAGTPIQASNAVTIDEVTTTRGMTVTSRAISVTSNANACSCAPPSHLQSIVLVVGTLGTTIATGTYALPSAEAWYYTQDPSMKPCCSTLVHASSGSITLTQVTPTVTVGSFDLLFPAGDHLTGTFTAPLCPSASQAADAATCP